MTEQRTPEWFAERADRVTGSIVGAILGCNPWMSRREVLQQKLGYKKFEGNAATEYGTFHEEYALADFTAEYSLQVNEVGLIVHPEHEWLAASPDGMIPEKNAVLEIKCPFGLRNDEQAAFKTIDEQPHYYAQIQIEMFCTGAERCYFYQWNRFAHDLQIIPFDPEFIEAHFDELHEFYLEFQAAKTADDSKLINDYEQALNALDDAKQKVEELKEQLIEAAKLRKTELIGGLAVRQIERKGAIDYKKVPELKGVDLEPYRKKPSKFWKVG